MANLFNRSWTRSELLNYVGDLSQIAGIKLGEWAERLAAGQGAELLKIPEYTDLLRSVHKDTRHRSAMDSLASQRSAGDGDSHVSQRVISQLLSEMDGVEELKGVLIIAATSPIACTAARRAR